MKQTRRTGPIPGKMDIDSFPNSLLAQCRLNKILHWNKPVTSNQRGAYFVVPGTSVLLVALVFYLVREFIKNFFINEEFFEVIKVHQFVSN